MIGAIIGDVIGSAYEWNNTKCANFELFGKKTDFTDDSVMTYATAHALLTGKDYGECYRDFGTRYPNRGYGRMFQEWLDTPSMGPYDSFGNGSAMRVSPIGYAFEDAKKVLIEAKKSAECSHSHPEGVKGAQAVALCIWLAIRKTNKNKIKDVVTKAFGYDLNRSLADIMPTYHFDETCQGSVPEAIICFLESDSFMDAIRKAILLGGDSDTIACITGSIAQAFYKEIPKDVAQSVVDYLPEEFHNITKDFYRTYKIKVKTV